MARQRRLSEIVRMLKRRLGREPRWKVYSIVSDLREYGVAKMFYDGDSIGSDITDSGLARALDRESIETAIRSQSGLRK